MKKLSIYTILFEDNSKYYLYNSRSNFFSEISNKLYETLKCERWDLLPNEVKKCLLDKEVIVEDRAVFDYYYSQLLAFNARNNDWSTLNLVLAPTTACNFACPYCFESQLTPKTMSDEVINALVEFVKTQERVNNIAITWYGGEPLLAFSQIKQIYSHLSQEGMPKIIAQSIITNGYCINEDVIDFFSEFGCEEIQITLDGLGAKHDKTRCLRNSSKPTFPIIMSNIEKILDKLRNTRLDIRVNINKENYMDFVEVYKFLKKKFPNNRRLNVYPGLIRKDAQDGKSLCQTSFSPDEILDLYRLLRAEGVNTSDFPKKVNRGCVMYHNGGFIIGPEGEIYKCWNDVTNKDAIVGNIRNKDLTNISLFLKYALQSIPFNEECKHCHAFPICDGGCGNQRYKNLFEDCNYRLCSPYKDIEKLKKALLTKDIPQ